MQDISTRTGASDQPNHGSITASFEAWTPEAGSWSPPSATDWPVETQQHLVALHTAWAVMHKDQGAVHALLEKLLDEEGVDAAEGAVTSLTAAAEYFGGLKEIIDAATARMMIVGLGEDFASAGN